MMCILMELAIQSRRKRMHLDAAPRDQTAAAADKLSNGLHHNCSHASQIDVRLQEGRFVLPPELWEAVEHLYADIGVRKDL